MLREVLHKGMWKYKKEDFGASLDGLKKASKKDERNPQIEARLFGKQFEKKIMKNISNNIL